MMLGNGKVGKLGDFSLYIKAIELGISMKMAELECGKVEL